VECKETAYQALLRVLELEDGPFLSQNGHYYESVRRKWLARYRSIRRSSSRYLITSSPLSESLPRRVTPISAENRALQALSELGYTDLQLEDLARLHPPDLFEEELTVMSDVRAYFQVAYKVGLPAAARSYRPYPLFFRSPAHH
jgi:vacuolar protein sorting-associated protein 1